jgi:hypothetical protein
MIRCFAVITCASAGERSGDFPKPVVVRRAALEAADGYRASWDNSEAAGRGKPAHDSQVEIAGRFPEGRSERSSESTEPFRRQRRLPLVRLLSPELLPWTLARPAAD